MTYLGILQTTLLEYISPTKVTCVFSRTGRRKGENTKMMKGEKMGSEQNQTKTETQLVKKPE